MLEQRDLQAIAELLDDRVSQTEERLDNSIEELSERIGTLESKVDTHDARFDRLEAKVDAHDARFDAMDKRISEVEGSLARELVRTENILTRKIDKLSSDMKELKRYYRMRKIENENTSMILQTLDKHDKRLVTLENHTGLHLV